MLVPPNFVAPLEVIGFRRGVDRQTRIERGFNASLKYFGHLMSDLRKGYRGSEFPNSVPSPQGFITIVSEEELPDPTAVFVLTDPTDETIQPRAVEIYPFVYPFHPARRGFIDPRLFLPISAAESRLACLYKDQGSVFNPDEIETEPVEVEEEAANCVKTSTELLRTLDPDISSRYVIGASILVTGGVQMLEEENTYLAVARPDNEKEAKVQIFRTSVW